jgi:hypothetical protein
MFAPRSKINWSLPEGLETVAAAARSELFILWLLLKNPSVIVVLGRTNPFVLRAEDRWLYRRWLTA